MDASTAKNSQNLALWSSFRLAWERKDDPLQGPPNFEMGPVADGDLVPLPRDEAEMKTATVPRATKRSFTRFHHAPDTPEADTAPPPTSQPAAKEGVIE